MNFISRRSLSRLAASSALSCGIWRAEAIRITTCSSFGAGLNPVSTSDKLKVKLGSSFAEEGDIVVVPEEDGYINIAWFLYEFIALNIPMKHVHAPGKCNKGMVGKLSKHLRISADDEDDDDIAVELPEGDISEGPQEIDPRWNELKKILDNN